MFCFYAHEKNARFVSVRKIVDDFSAFKDCEYYSTSGESSRKFSASTVLSLAQTDRDSVASGIVL